MGHSDPVPAGLAVRPVTMAADGIMEIWISSYGLSWLDLTIKLWESPLAQQSPVLK